MRARLKSCEADKGEYLAGWQRGQRGFGPMLEGKRREERRYYKFSEGAGVELVNLADSFDGLYANKAGEKIKRKVAARDGAFAFSTDEYNEKPGVEAIESLGKIFNPQSESIGEVAVDKEEKDSIVMEEAQRGYKMRGMVIRPSLVKLGRILKIVFIFYFLD